MEDLHIEQIRPELTRRLRHEVLYPAEPLHTMAKEEDNNGLHFGAFFNNQLVGVVSMFQKGADYQFRKFAIDPQMQGKGFGHALLQYIINFAALQGGSRLWCNARLSAIWFYSKAGFTSTSATFSKNGFDYEVFEKTLP